MNEEFIRIIKRGDKLVDVGSLPMGVVLEVDRAQVIIPECCREGWDSCPHVPKRFKQSKKNIGL